MSGIRNLALLVDLARHLQHVAPRHFDSEKQNHDDEKQKDDTEHDCGGHNTTTNQLSTLHRSISTAREMQV